MSSVLDWLFGCGFVCVSAYCLNALGFIDPAVMKSTFSVTPLESTPVESVTATPSPSESPSADKAVSVEETVSAIEETEAKDAE